VSDLPTRARSPPPDVTDCDRSSGRRLARAYACRAIHANVRTNETSAERDRQRGQSRAVPGPPPSRRPGARGGDATTTKRKTKKTENRKRVIVPTPEEWAQQQLKNAPPRSEEWAKRVARIYSLDIGDSGSGEKEVS